MHLLDVVLASLAGAYDFDSVDDCGGPVESLSKSISDKGVWCCMVATSLRVFILKQFLPFLDGYAPWQDP